MDDVAIVCRSLGRHCGVAETATHLAEHLMMNLRQSVVVTSGVSSVPSEAKVVILEVEHGVYGDNLQLVLDDIRDLRQRGCISIVNYHSVPVGSESWVPELLRYSIVAGRITPTIEGTWPLPLVGPPPFNGVIPNPPNEIHLGSHGFCGPHKYFEEIVRLALRLDTKLTLLTVNDGPWQEVIDNLHQLSDGNLKIEMCHDWLSYKEVISRLRNCSHLISAVQDYDGILSGSQSGSSGSFRMMARVGRPFIGLRHFRASEVHAIEVDSLDDITVDWLKEQTSPPYFDDGIEKYRQVINYARSLS